MALVRMADESKNRFQRFCEHHGVSMAALFDAMSLRLPSDEEIARNQRQLDIIAEARAADADGRRRG